MTNDLSKTHELVSDLFQADSDEAPLRLTREQLDFFDEFGFVKGVRVLNDGQIERLRSELEDLFDPAHDGADLWYEYHSSESEDAKNVLFHALGAWRLRPALHDILWHRHITVPASQLLEGAVRFWHDQLFCKPAHHGGVVAWHQDYSYWTRTTPMAHLTCWIGLDDADKDKWVPSLHSGQPSLGSATRNRSGRRHERHSGSSNGRSMGDVSKSSCY